MDSIGATPVQEAPRSAAQAIHGGDDAPIPGAFREYLRSFGPGLVAVLTWLGSGDIVSAGVAGGNYGYALMWAMVFALLMRYFFVTTIAKYQLCNPHGDGVLDGLVRLQPLYAPFVFFATVLWAHVSGTYLVAGIGELSVGLAGFGTPSVWSLLWISIGLVLLFRPLYASIEWVFKFLLVALSVSLIGTALWVGPDPVAVFRGTFTFVLPPQQGAYGAMFVAMSMVGAVGGSLMNLVYPYFLEQKGWNAPKYRRVQTYDFLLAVIVMIVFNLAVWTLGAELVHGTGRRIQNLEDLTGLLGLALGRGGRVLFLVGVFAAVYTSLLGSGFGLGSLASHAFQRWRGGEQVATANRMAHPVYTMVAVWTLVSPLIWTIQGRADFVALTLLGNSTMVLLIPVLAGGLWWITANPRFIGAEHMNRRWENALMGLLFGLAIWGTWSTAQSLIRIVFPVTAP